MVYAQKNYPQTQGINGRFSISSIGCFLTAMCNLEADFGNNIDPLGLNSFFVSNRVYIDIDDGVLDDLGWDSVTHFDSKTIVSHTVDHGTDQTAGWPKSNESIVRFHYRSISNPTLANGQPNMIFHFCKVADAAAHLILDSWDGQVKKSPYGEPTAWAEYAHDVPVAPPAPPTPKYTVVETYTPAKWIRLNKQPTCLWGMNYDFDFMKDHPVEVHNKDEKWQVVDKVHHQDGYYYYRREGQVDGFNILDCDDYTPPAPATPPQGAVPANSPPYGKPIVKDIPGYMTATNAANHTNSVSVVKAGSSYYLFTSKYGMDNVSLSPGIPGAWINPADNVPDPVPVEAPKPVSPNLGGWNDTPKPIPVTPKPEPVKKSDNPTWGYLPFKDRNGENAIMEYVAITDTKVIDLQRGGEHPLLKKERIGLAGTLVKDGVTYGRYYKSAKNYTWWCVDMKDVILDSYEEPEPELIVTTDKKKNDKHVKKDIKISDYLMLAESKLKKELPIVDKVIDGFVRPKKRK